MSGSYQRIETIETEGSIPKASSPEAVLRDVARLLEEYAPVWYTEDHHRRVQAALRPDPARRPPAILGVR